MRLAIAVDVLEQCLAGQFLKLADDPPQGAVSDRHLVLNAALALEAHLHFVSIVVDLAAQQGGRAEALVLPGILLIADAQVIVVEQADDRGDDLVPA